MRFFLVLFFLMFFSSNSFALKERNVLILNSYHKGFEYSDTIIKNIEKLFYNNQNINISVLYMNSKQIDSNEREYISKLKDLYSLQVKNKNYDLVIALDRFAYKFTVKNYKNLFEKEKILFIGIEQYSKELAKIYELDKKLNGIIQRLAIEENIQIIKKLMPNLKKLYILNDRSPNGNDTSSFIIKAMKKFKKDFEIEYLRDETLKKLKSHFQNYRQNEAILFVRFSKDSNGKYYKTNELTNAIKKFSLPVFATDTLFLGKGIIGGKLVSMDKLGVLSGNFALDILNKKVSKASIKTYNSYENIFDYEQLTRFKIGIPRDLKDFELINTPQSFFDRNRDLINNVFLVTPLLIIVIFGLLEALYSKQKATNKLKQRLEFDYALLNAIDSPIFWQDKNGIILDTNRKFCNLIDIEYDELIGMELKDFEKDSLTIRRVIRVLEQLGENKVDFILKDKFGKKKTYYIKQTSFESLNHEDGIVTIFTDITKEKKIEQEREKQTQYILQQSKMAEIGEIFSSIAHQWKSPLIAITALAQDLFYQNNSSQKEEDSYHIKNIMLQANYMTDTINEFQDFIVPSKEKTVFNVKQTLDKMLNIVQHNMKYNYINVQIKVEENTKLDIFGYENEFMQAILNIVNNAKDALLLNNEKNRNITIVLKNRLNTLVLDLMDNGPGIKKEDKKRIFLQYFSTKEKGHGIGLYMTKLIIQDKLNGKIYYKNSNIGTHFRIILKIFKDKKK